MAGVGDGGKPKCFYKPSDLFDWLKAYESFKGRVDLKAAIIATLKALVSDADMLGLQEQIIGLIESGRIRIPHSKTLDRFTCRLEIDPLGSTNSKATSHQSGGGSVLSVGKHGCDHQNTKSKNIRRGNIEI